MDIPLQLNTESDHNIRVFDWHRIFYSNEIPLDYLAEIALRTVFMFLILIVALKFLSKRGVKQLSVFELAILIALGSATGDPMFYNSVPLTWGVVVMIVVIFLYRFITSLTAKSKKLETLLEGRPVCLLSDGLIDVANYKKVGLPYDKFFAELRLKGVEHLGQLKKVYLETSGELSAYFNEDEKVVAGLPIFPELLDHPHEHISSPAAHACLYCGHVEQVGRADQACSRCEEKRWILPKTNGRVK